MFHIKNISLKTCLFFLWETATRFINAIFPPRCLKCSCFIIRNNKYLQKVAVSEHYLSPQKHIKSKQTIQQKIIQQKITPQEHPVLKQDKSSLKRNDLKKGDLKKNDLKKDDLKKDEQSPRNLLSDFFCNNCMNEGVFIPFSPPFCIKCGKKFKNQTNENHLCEECIKNKIRIGKVRAAGIYQGILRESIHLFKYNGKTQLAFPLELILFEVFKKYFSMDTIDLILPVPLHRAKLVKRGFNQSFLLIKDFRHLWKLWKGIYPQWKIDYTLLARTKNTKSQIGFDKKDRKKNIKDAFRVIEPDKIKDKRIILVDDVYTTGSTAGESASVLFNAGAISVDVLVLARA